MTYDLLKKKLEAEKDVTSNMGIYKTYSFLMEVTSYNSELVRDFMLELGISKTEATRVASRFNHYNRTKSFVPGRAF